MTNCGYGKLGKNNLTDLELFDLCYEILLVSKADLSSSEISKILKSDYGKDIPSRRISMNLNSDPRFVRAYKLSDYNQNILIWSTRLGAKNASEVV